MKQLPEDDQAPSEVSGYVINPENTAEMARLTVLAEYLSREMGLLPSSIDLASCTEILDIGCGPGGWVMEIARCCSTSRVRGIDISALMTAYAQFCAQTEGLTNVQFLQADARQRLPFPDATFDLVHIRLASAWLNKKLWPAIMQEYWRVVKPGGIVCCVECENIGITTSVALTRYAALGVEAMRNAQQCFSPSSDHSGVTVMLPSFFRDAGFHGVKLEAHALPYSFGTSGYRSMVDNLTSALKLMQPFMLRQGVTTQIELDTLYEQMVNDMQKEDFEALMYYLRMWGTR